MRALVAESGEAKLVDFGLAALLDAPAAQATMLARERSGPVRAEPTSTEGGELVGTPYFMSPEAWGGDDLDARSDLYSLGLVLYELLAGEGPWRELDLIPA